MLCIIIKKDQYYNYSYATVRFGPLGDQTKYKIITCNDWKTGFTRAREQGYTKGLFIQSGTVFNDIDNFIRSIESYPHRGLIGHIIDPLDNKEFYSLNPQCFYLDLDNFSADLFDNKEFTSPQIVRSDQNIHDGYTPLWIRPGNKTVTAVQNKFGQRLIAHQLSQGKIVVNWHQKLRDNKIYLYRDEIRDQWIQTLDAYKDMAENQLWITNNQHLPKITTTKLISPASGLFWIMNLAVGIVTQIDLVDISNPQIRLAEQLLCNWNGKNYSEFVFNFIKQNNIKHLQLDVELTPVEKLKIQNRKYFCERVDILFQQHLAMFGLTPETFQQKWNTFPRSNVTVHNGNIVELVNNQKVTVDSDTTLWISNILDYKYTWVCSSLQDIEHFQQISQKAKYYEPTN
jgi:hypothetical protein